MSTYFSGPWVADGLEVWMSHAVRINSITAGVLQVATICDHALEGNRYSAESTVRLIAAAPDLLEALNRCVQAMRYAEYSEEIILAERAIAKALGEQS